MCACVCVCVCVCGVCVCVCVCVWCVCVCVCVLHMAVRMNAIKYYHSLTEAVFIVLQSLQLIHTYSTHSFPGMCGSVI